MGLQDQSATGGFSLADWGQATLLHFYAQPRRNPECIPCLSCILNSSLSFFLLPPLPHPPLFQQRGHQGAVWWVQPFTWAQCFGRMLWKLIKSSINSCLSGINYFLGWTTSLKNKNVFVWELQIMEKLGLSTASATSLIQQESWECFPSLSCSINGVRAEHSTWIDSITR